MQKYMDKIKKLLQLDLQEKELLSKQKISEVEQEVLESKQQFESVFYSNKLEGNKLTEEEAKTAICLDQ